MPEPSALPGHHGAVGDLLGMPGERVLTASDEAADVILHSSGLAVRAALTPCPTRCARCAEKVG